MELQDMDRRTLLKGGGAAFAGLTVLQVAGPAQAFPGDPGEEEVLEWLDQPDPVPEGVSLPNLLKWEELDSWQTGADEFFVVSHFNEPVLDAEAWRLGIGGLVAKPQTLTLADLKDPRRPRREVDFTLECSGNTGLPFFIGGIGNARWAGTPLAPILKRAGVKKEGIEVVFWGADAAGANKDVPKQTIRDNTGVLGPGRTGSVEKDAQGNLDLTITEHFARSMTLDDAMNPDNLLCYEMNGVPLPREHGFPVRLIAPGWYGVANVKWLTHIEVWDQQYRGKFMARDYVTIREQERDGETVWTFANVRHDRLKSAPAKVTRRDGRYRIMGAAWGAPIDQVEVRVDKGPWTRARLHRQPSHGRQARKFAWRFWTLDWGTPAAGEHEITSRAFDTDGNVQPAPDDKFLASKVTFWESNGQITRRVLIPAH